MLREIKALLLKKPYRLPDSISSFHHEVIAREGNVYSHPLLEAAAESGRGNPLRMVPLKESFVPGDIRKLIERENQKYGFLVDEPKHLDNLTLHMGALSLPEKVFEELKRLKDHYTYNYHHVLGVACIVARMALDFGWDEAEVGRAIEAAFLFDIGIGHIPEEILDQPEALTASERKLTSAHPVYSALLIAHYYQDPDYRAIEPVLNHHENLDGSGYPRKVQNSDLLSNMIRAADLFDALISERPFRKYFSSAEAMELCEKEIDEGKIMHEVFPLLFFYHKFLQGAKAA